MFIKFVVVFSVLALAVAFGGGSVPVKGPTYHITLNETAAINGTTLKAGEYRVTVNANQATFVLGKFSQDFAVKIETADKKFPSNTLMFTKQGDKNNLKQIGLGGSKTRLVFE